MSKEDTKFKMDPRCPRKLEHHPDSYCPLAVLRLKRLRHVGKELSEEEESKLPGCCWSINHQMSCYCFFKYAHEYLDGNNPPSDVEIAHMNSISVDSVKKTAKEALEKVKNSDTMAQIAEHYEGESVIDPIDEDPEYEVKYR